MCRWGGVTAMAAAAAGLLISQSGGRFDEAKRLAFLNVRDGQFDKAAVRLEEVWEQQRPPDSAVAEHLAMAYLNGEDRKSRRDLEAKAYELMGKSIAAGGQATFVVNHSHEGFGAIQGNNWTRFCRGRLSVRPGRIIYVSEAGERVGEDSFDIEPAGLREFSEGRGDRGVFRLRIRDAAGKERNYNMAPRSWSAQDTRELIRLVTAHVSK